MKDEDVLEKSGFAAARKDGGHNLYVRARLRCTVGDHVVQKDFTVDAWDVEKLKPESWVCVEHLSDHDRLFGSETVDVRCGACGKLVSLTMQKGNPIPLDFRCEDCQS
jgi:hypothetical protein